MHKPSTTLILTNKFRSSKLFPKLGDSILKNNTISKLKLFPIKQNWKVPSNSAIVNLSIGTKSNKLPIFEIPKKVLKF